MGLKIALASKINHPLRTELRESAFLLDDMLRAVEMGYNDLSPRAKGRIWAGRPLTNRGMPVNKVLAKKIEIQSQKAENERSQKILMKAHNAKLKEALKGYSKDKELKRKQDEEKVREA
jgi:hypothetical protein